jgi:hypothetical protein
MTHRQETVKFSKPPPACKSRNISIQVKVCNHVLKLGICTGILGQAATGLAFPTFHHYAMILRLKNPATHNKWKPYLPLLSSDKNLMGKTQSVSVRLIQTSIIFATRSVYTVSNQENLIFVHIGTQQSLTYTKPKQEFVL